MQEVDIFWHLYDTKLHGARLSTRAIHKIIDLISTETLDSAQHLDLSPDELYRVDKKKEQKAQPTNTTG